MFLYKSTTNLKETQDTNLRNQVKLKFLCEMLRITFYFQFLNSPAESQTCNLPKAVESLPV